MWNTFGKSELEPFFPKDVSKHTHTHTQYIKIRGCIFVNTHPASAIFGAADSTFSRRGLKISGVFALILLLILSYANRTATWYLKNAHFFWTGDPVGLSICAAPKGGSSNCDNRFSQHSCSCDLSIVAKKVNFEICWSTFKFINRFRASTHPFEAEVEATCWATATPTPPSSFFLDSASRVLEIQGQSFTSTAIDIQMKMLTSWRRANLLSTRAARHPPPSRPAAKTWAVRARKNPIRRCCKEAQGEKLPTHF